MRYSTLCYHFQYSDGYDPALAADFVSLQQELLAYAKLGGFYPKRLVPVVRDNNEGRELVNLEWGLVPRDWTPGPYASTRKVKQGQCWNAVSERVHKTKSYAQSFVDRRCLILGTGFYEHGRWFHLPDKRIFAFAGLWDRWEGDGEVVESCTMLTTEAIDIVAEVHPKKRMPVIFSEKAQCDRWLNPDNASRDSVEELITPFDRLSTGGGRLDEHQFIIMVALSGPKSQKLAKTGSASILPSHPSPIPLGITPDQRMPKP